VVGSPAQSPTSEWSLRRRWPLGHPGRPDPEAGGWMAHSPRAASAVVTAAPIDNISVVL